MIGVAKDAHYTGVRSEVKPTVYLPYTDSLTGLHQMTFVVRTVLPPLAIAGAGRLVVAATDRSMPVAEMKTEEQQIDESIATERLSPHSLARLAVSLRCCRHRALWRDGVRSSAANSGDRNPACAGSPPRHRPMDGTAPESLDGRAWPRDRDSCGPGVDSLRSEYFVWDSAYRSGQFRCGGDSNNGCGRGGSLDTRSPRLTRRSHPSLAE